MFKRLVLVGLMLATINMNCVDQESLTYQALGAYFQELMDQDDDMVETIKTNFGVSDPALIDFLIEQLDPINLAIDLFKQYFTLEEIKTIVAFHTSNTGRKFGNLFQVVMQDYSYVLNQRIQDCKLAIATIIVETNKQ